MDGGRHYDKSIPTSGLWPPAIYDVYHAWRILYHSNWGEALKDKSPFVCAMGWFCISSKSCSVQLFFNIVSFWYTHFFHIAVLVSHFQKSYQQQIWHQMKFSAYKLFNQLLYIYIYIYILLNCEYPIKFSFSTTGKRNLSRVSKSGWNCLFMDLQQSQLVSWRVSVGIHI